MYRIFLVEDEIVIREGIKELIAWNEYGFTFVGEAPDGELAWPLIQKLKPDIVITDIKMPFMDGLALSRLIKKDLPDTTIMILSGYDDFAYAKEAISIGVSQYLLKPLSKDQLVEVLRETKKQKDKELEQARYRERFNSELQEYMTNSRKGFFDALVSGKQSVAELLERAEKLGLPLLAERYNVVLFLLEEDLVQNRYTTQLADLQEGLGASLPEGNHLLRFSLGADLIAFLILADAQEIEAQTQACVAQLVRLCEPIKPLMEWSVVVGRPVSRLSAVTDCYRAARKQLFHRSAFVHDHVYRVGETVPADAAPVTVDFDPNDLDAGKLDQRIIEKFLANGLAEDISGFVTDYFDSMDSKAAESLLFRQYLVLNIQFTVNAFLEKLNCPKETETPGKTEATLKDAVVSRSGAEQYMSQLFSRALALRDKLVNSRGSSMLKNALAYIGEHFSDPEISLNAAAKAANVSATHFSAVFSQLMGKTFTEYLTELRMEKARELLRCTDKSSGEIAFEAGYNDPHYFSFLFKKANGCSPRDYRAGRRSS